jgi:multidrug efflux pump subunit AcrA (membrane-fusion protein)
MIPVHLAIVLATLTLAQCRAAPPPSSSAASPAVAAPTAARLPVERTLRLVGVVEAVRAYSVMVPRFRGQSGGPLVLTRLVPGGSHVEAGDVVAEIDPQDQERVARDRRSTVLNLDEQIRKMQADQVANRARDDTELTVAGSDVERARLAVTTNKVLPRLDGEKNLLSLEQAEARLAELRKTYELKRQAAAAELRILEIRRDRAQNELKYAEQNVGLMAMSAPFAGLVVPKTTNRNGQMTEVQEGDEARPGMPILDVVDPSAMRVRVRVNQGDIGALRVGQGARVSLDAYPELSFEGRVDQISPVAVTSGVTPSVRTFAAIVSVAGRHEKLMPDLTAAVEIVVVSGPDEETRDPRDSRDP